MTYSFLVVSGAVREIITRTERTTEIQRNGTLMLANSGEEAEGIIMRSPKKDCPTDDGWQGHWVMASELSKERLIEHVQHARPLRDIPPAT